jgi:hypothetical protein
MKRIIKVLLAVALAAALCLSQGCAGNLLGAKEFPSDYEVAVIRTSDYVKPTYIEFYDEELNLICTTDYPYICLENLVNDPCVLDDVVYMPHRGSYNGGRNGGQVIALSIQTGEVQEYAARGGEVTATDKNIFVVSGSNTPRITQIDKETGESFDITLGEGYLHSCTTNGEVVALAQHEFDSVDETLLMFRDASNVEKEIKITGLGDVSQIEYINDGRLFFTAALYNIDSETYDHTLNYYSPTDESVRTITHYDWSLGSIVESGEYLFITQDDPNAVGGNEIIVIDKESEDVVDTFALPFYPEYMEAHNGFLYLLGFYRNTGAPCFAQYRIDGSRLTHVIENKLDEGLTKTTREKGNPIFATGMFFRD